MRQENRPRPHDRNEHRKKRRNPRSLRMPRMRRNQNHLRTNIGYTTSRSTRSRSMRQAGGILEKPIRPLVFSIIVIAATVSVVVVLNMLDQIVHGQLYNYGLQFSLEWANPYWNLLRITQALLGIIAAATTINAILTLRKYLSTREPKVKVTQSQRPTARPQTPSRPISPATRTAPQNLHPTEKSFDKQVPHTPAPILIAPTPSPTPAYTPSTTSTPTPSQTGKPTPAPYPQDVAGTTRCSHCGKAFTQPLRMLDFQGDRPRIVNICPFCNEILTATSRQTDTEQDKKFTLRRKNGNNHSANSYYEQATS